MPAACTDHLRMETPIDGFPLSIQQPFAGFDRISAPAVG
jgi:hypothetical protein